MKTYNDENDLILDDVKRIEGFKQGFIEMMADIRKHISADDFNEYCIDIEQMFNDMIGGKYNRLCEEGGYPDDMPVSPWYKAWLLTTRKRLFKNPATEIQKELIERAARNNALADSMIDHFNANGLAAITVEGNV